MNKRFSLILVMMLIIQTITSSFVLPMQAIAEGTKQSVITGITVTDAVGNEFHKDMPAGTTVNIQVDWSVVDVEVGEGSTESFSIPTELYVEQEQTGILTDGEIEVGTYQASINGNVSLTFNKEVEEHVDASGAFALEAFVADHTAQEEKVESESISEEPVEEQVIVEEESKSETIGENDDESTGENTFLDKADSNSTVLDKVLEQVTEEEKHGFILELGQVTDLEGNPYTEESLLNPTDKFKLDLRWNLENGHTYKAGDRETFNLPKGIKIIEEITGELKDGSLVVATYKISTDKKVELTFTDFVETHSNVQGWLQIISTLDEKNVDVEDGEAIIDPIGEEGEIRIPIEQGNKEKTIEKKGTPNKGYNADEINWEVIINKHKTSLTNAKITDILPAGTEYKENSLKVIKLKVDLYGNILGDIEEVVVTGETVVDGELTIPLGDIGDAYRIEYVTTVTDDEKREFTNNVTFSDDLMEAVNAKSTVTINRGEAIKKKAAKSYNPKTGMIEWEIEFNYNLKDLSDVTFKDAWTPKGKLELVDGSLKFTEVTIDENGNAHETENVGLPEGAVLIPGTDQFEITGITTNKAYKLTYQTKLKERVLDPFEVVNTAGFGTETAGSGTGVGTYYGSKSAGTVDYKNKTIDWKIEINHDEYPMENIMIMDTLGEGLTLKEDTLTITVDGNKYTDYTLSGDNPFTIKFPDNFTTDKKIVITYKTNYVADEVPNHQPTNKAAITWTPEGGNESITKEVVAGTELNNNTKNSHWKNGSYDPSSKEITWTIYTNYRENQIDRLLVRDAPQGNQKIVADSVVVTELAIEENGSITEVGQLDSNVVSIDENANTLQITIGETNKAYKIVYKTSLAGLSDIQKEYVNKAEVLDGSEKLTDLNAKVGIAKSDTYGEKSGYQDGKQVHWSVKVNLGQQKISNLTLVDRISTNQEYLTDTIKIYEATVDRNGNATKGDELSVEQYDLTYTPGNSTFTVKWKYEVERAFIVEYSTLFFEKHNGEVTNTYNVTGDNIIEGGTTNGDGTVTIKQLSSGGGSGEVGYLVIDKVDVTYGKDETKLLGAEFDLIDADTEKVLKTGKTDVNGQIDFGRLLFGEYELHERVVPDGYVTKDERQTIVIDKKYEAGNDETKLEYRIENYEPVFAIELTKTDAEDSSLLLEGAEFALFDSEDATIPIKTGTTDESGKILFKDLPGAGTYYVQETKAAEFYELNAEKIPVKVGEIEQVPVNIIVENQLIPGKGSLKKVDADNPDSVLEGAIFEVFSEEGTIVDTITTDINGVAITKELRPGTYTLIEKTPPNGFKKSTTVHELVIPKANEILEYDISEEPITNEVKTAKIELRKSDSINGNQLLKGAVFELEYKSGKYSHPLSSGTTGENGKVTFENLKPGTYEIKEINAPEGYILNTEPITVEVTLDDVHFDRTVKGNIENDPLANIIIQKEDMETNAKLKDAEFKVTDETGNEILTGLKTDANGQISITGLSEGQYNLVETKAPMGYMLDPTPQRFTVVKDGVDETIEINLTFNNEIIKGSVELVKVDGDNNNVPLEGVKFALRATSLINGGSYTETTHTTDSNGKIVVDNLRPGNYEFIEIGPLEGYQPYWKNITFTINLQDEKHELVLPDIVNYKLVDVPVTKEWNDGENEDRPTEITVDLFQNDEKIEETTITASDNWNHIFTGLDAVDSNGTKYEYTVKEQKIDSYQQGQTGNFKDGFVITNVLTTSIHVMKEWKDEKESDRPVNITVELYRTIGEKEDLVETKTINSTDDWKYTFTNLPVYDKDGNAYEYHVKEIALDKKYMLEGIVKDGNIFTITNVRTGETKVEVEKEWRDNGDATGDRPDEITVDLYQNDTHLTELDASIKADEEGNWKYTFENLPEFDEEGKTYTYTIKEQDVEGYTLKEIVETENGYKIINVRSGETKVAVEKEWKDNENATGDRPDEITVELYQNDTHLTELDASIKADEKGNWKYTFENLPEFDEEGKAYTYTVKENDVMGYISSMEAIDEGFKITNLRTDTIDVVGKKTWIEVEEQYRPDFITVNLLANGEPIEESLEVTANHEWEYEFTGLNRFDSEGKEITYTIEEENVVGYKSSVDGYNITNAQESIEISGTKIWKDNEDATGDRPESIIVQVMKGDTVVKEQVVTAENKWEYTFTDLAKYDKDGNEIMYEINELPVPGYTTTINGFDIVNTRTDKVDVEGTKSWKDDESEERPTEITVQLLANGEEVDTTVVTEATDWKFEFKDLDAYDNDGIAIDYQVTEEVEGYKAIINGYDITNVRVGTTSVEGTKTWKDDDSTDRPEEIVVKLLQNDVEIDTVEVTAATDWNYSFTNLDMYDENGVAFKYTIEEVPVDGYETSIEGFDITNLRVGKKDVKGKKTWLDDTSTDRPESITVYLLANGEKTGKSAEVTVESDWKYAFTNLDKYDNQGVEIVYSVDEEAVDGYETIINGYDITNLRIGTTEIEVTKLWIDEQEIERPETIKVNLLQNGDFYAEYEVTKENDWKRTITDLPKYDEAGKTYEYTVKEQDVAGYASKIDGFEITNTRADVKSIEITKTWLDDDSKERPSSIEVELFRSITNGEKELVDTYTVTADSDWFLEIEDLPVFNENGKAYTYEIKEKAVAGYESSVNGFEITNLRVGSTSVEGMKTWKDDNSKERPEMIKINLLQNGVVVQTKEVTAEMDWKYSFTNIDKYDENGVAYEYTVKEEAIEGYKTIIDGYDITNVRVGTTTVEGTKTWKDDNSIHRPDSIVVELLQNGNKIQEVVVKASQDWKFSFKDLPEYDENGVAYNYTVKEQKVEGYSSTAEGFDIINTLLPVTPEIEVPGETTPNPEDDQKAPEEEVSGTPETGGKLPDTATNMFNVVALGVALLLVGFTIILVYRRKEKA